MTNLNDIINQKAQELYPDFIPGIENSAAEPFRKGVDWATTDPLILQALLQPFGDWLLEKAWVVAKGVYEIDGEKGQFTMEELIQKYFADNKQKEDADKKATETNP